MRRRLTARFVETAGTAGSRAEIRDEVARGLVLRVTPSGKKSWSVIYRRKADGERRRYTIGRYPEFALEDARAEAKQIGAAVARGEDPASRVRLRRQALCFRDLVDLYVEQFAKHNKSPMVLYDDRLKLAKDAWPGLDA